MRIWKARGSGTRKKVAILELENVLEALVLLPFIIIQYTFRTRKMNRFCIQIPPNTAAPRQGFAKRHQSTFREGEVALYLVNLRIARVVLSPGTELQTRVQGGALESMEAPIG